MKFKCDYKLCCPNYVKIKSDIKFDHKKLYKLVYISMKKK